ncbi:MerR family transcriptional regulator, partial [Microcella sp.]
MSELSATTGTPVPTLKFYLREGLLPAGERTSPNQSQYDDSHVERV